MSDLESATKRFAHLAFMAWKAPSDDALPPSFDEDLGRAAEEYECALIESDPMFRKKEGKTDG